MDRRRVLRGGAALLAALAGCAGGDGPPLRVTGTERDDLADAVRIRGTVRNEGNEAVSGVVVAARFFSETDELLGLESASVGRLGADQSAQFTIEYGGDPADVDDYQVTPSTE